MKVYKLILILSFLFLTTSKITNINLDTDKIYIVIDKEIFQVNLLQNEITEELITLLPLKIKLIEESRNETMKYLPLNTQIEIPDCFSSEIVKGNKGDIILYKGNKIIILSESSLFNNLNGNDYIKIGKIYDEKFFNSFSKNKSILLWNTLNYENQKEKVKPYAFYTSLMNFFTWKIFTIICFILL
jgi:hypothetical protein